MSNFNCCLMALACYFYFIVVVNAVTPPSPTAGLRSWLYDIVFNLPDVNFPFNSTEGAELVNVTCFKITLQDVASHFVQPAVNLTIEGIGINCSGDLRLYTLVNESKLYDNNASMAFAIANGNLSLFVRSNLTNNLITSFSSICSSQLDIPEFIVTDTSGNKIFWGLISLKIKKLLLTKLPILICDGFNFLVENKTTDAIDKINEKIIPYLEIPKLMPQPNFTGMVSMENSVSRILFTCTLK